MTDLPSYANKIEEADDINVTLAFTQSARKALVATCFDPDDGSVIEEDRSLLLKSLDSMDRSIATKTKLTQDESEADALSKDRAVCLAALLEIGKSTGLKEVFTQGAEEEYTVGDDIPMIPDLDIDITEGTLNKSKSFESLEDFNDKFGNDFRDRQSK